MTDNPNWGKGLVMRQEGFPSHLGHANHLLPPQKQHNLQNFRSLAGESQNSDLGKLSNITPKLLVEQLVED